MSLGIRLGQQPSHTNEGVPSTAAMEYTPRRAHQLAILIDPEVPVWSGLSSAGKHSSGRTLQPDQTYLWDNSLIPLHQP